VSLKQDGLDKASNYTKRGKVFHASDYLYKEGQKFSGLYVIQVGCVKSYVIDSNGNENIHGFYFPMDILGLNALFSQHKESAVALSTTSVCIINYNSILDQELLKLTNNTLLHVMSEYMACIFKTKKRSSESRLASYLIHIAKKTIYTGSEECLLTLDMSKKDVANYLDMTAETVSREIAKLAKQGIISIKNNTVRIHKIKHLEFISIGRHDKLC
jgi:cAMP-binding proteins - catabolite gene activator and regulatory subunit of cAMP-dependent protein kinases